MPSNNPTVSGMTRQVAVQPNTSVTQLSAPITGRDSKPGTTTVIRLEREGEDDDWEKQRRFEQVGQEYNDHVRKSADARGMEKWYNTQMEVLAAEKERIPKRIAELEKERELLGAKLEEVLRNEAAFVAKHKAEADQGEKDRELKERYEQYLDLQIQEMVVEGQAGDAGGEEGEEFKGVTRHDATTRWV